MATFRNDTAAALEFPTLKDKAGNTLVAPAGETFEGPDDLVADGISIVTGGGKAAKSAPAAEPVAAEEEVVD